MTAHLQPPPPRSRAQRIADTLDRLARDVDLWVATASDDGSPCLVPLSFAWDGQTLLLATPPDSPTGRNLRASGVARLGVGPTRDVVLVEATAEQLGRDAVPDEVADAFAESTGFDPREEAVPYAYFRLRPQRVRAWREANELPTRLIMRDGRWLES